MSQIWPKVTYLNYKILYKKLVYKIKEAILKLIQNCHYNNKDPRSLGII